MLCDAIPSPHNIASLRMHGILCWTRSRAVGQDMETDLKAVAIGVTQVEGLLNELKVTDIHAAQPRICRCQPCWAHLHACHLLQGCTFNYSFTERMEVHSCLASVKHRQMNRCIMMTFAELLVYIVVGQHRQSVSPNVKSPDCRESH